MRAYVRHLAGLVVSIVLIVVLLAYVDLSDFSGLSRRLRWPLIGPSFAALAIIGVAFAYRWRLLLERTLPLRDSVVATFVGLAGNMVLPARGGDLLRVYFSSRLVSGHRALSRLFLEKILDLATVIAVGIGAIGATSTFAHSGSQTRPVLVTAGTTLAILVIGLLVLRFGGSLIVRGSDRLLARATWSRPYYDHVHRFLSELVSGGRMSLLVAPAVVTVALWLLLYGPTFMLVAAFSGVPLTFAEAAVVMFTSAIGLAVPAAPSGVGTFHASVVSGFVLLGRSPGEGLVYATVLHGVFFVSFVLMGLAVYPYYLRHRSPKAQSDPC